MRTDISKLAIRRRAEKIKVRKTHIYRECQEHIKKTLYLASSVHGGIAGAKLHQVQTTRGQEDDDSRYQVTVNHDVTLEPVSLMAAHVAFFLAHGHWLFDEA